MKYYCDHNRHLICVPYSIEGLHEMAKDLKIGDWWFHARSRFPHYDIPKRRIKEITEKCEVVETKVIIGVIKRALNMP